jgi:hypothetical protein
MTFIHVPRPPKGALNPNRAVSSLLQAQIQHLHAAERKLPLRCHSKIYINAIKTEGEAAAYIRDVTEAIHKAHNEAAAKRTMRVQKHKPGMEIAVVLLSFGFVAAVFAMVVRRREG